MAGRPHGGQLRPGVPTTQLHQPSRWFQVSDYPPLLYLARIEHSPFRRAQPRNVVPSKVPSPRSPVPSPQPQPPPLVSSRRPSHPPATRPPRSPSRARFAREKAKLQLSSSPALQLQLQCLCSRLCTLPRQLVFHMLLFLPIRRPLRLLLRPRLAGSPAMQSWVHLIFFFFPFLSSQNGLPASTRSDYSQTRTCQWREGTLDHGARTRKQLRFGRRRAQLKSLLA